jgi:transposase InsO family protein
LGYQRLLNEHGVQQSMSRRANCLDNAVTESFLGTLKSEFFYQQEFRSIEQLQEGLKEYIHYYNHDPDQVKIKRTESCRF